MDIVTSKNKKSVRKPRNVLISPDTLHEARVEALPARKTIGEWLEAIEEKIERDGAWQK